MKDAPSQAEMTQATNAQGGAPNYVDKTAETANSNFYPNRGQDAPAYKYSSSRYWEYR